MTPVLYCFVPVIIEVHFQCYTGSVGLREICTPTSRAEISSSSLYLKAVKGAPIQYALIGATSELTNSNRKKNSQKAQPFLLKRNLDLAFIPLNPYIYLNLAKKGNAIPINNNTK